MEDLAASNRKINCSVTIEKEVFLTPWTNSEHMWILIIFNMFPHINAYQILYKSTWGTPGSCRQ